MRTDGSFDETEAWMVVEVWNSERSLRLFQDNSSYLTIIKAKDQDHGWSVFSRVSKDLDDSLIYCLKQSVLQPEEMFYVVVVIEIIEPVQTNEPQLNDLLKSYGTTIRYAKGCNLYTFSKVLSDEKVEYVVYYFHDSAASFEASQDSLVESLQSSIAFYKLCNVLQVTKSVARPTYKKIVLGERDEKGHAPLTMVSVPMDKDVLPNHAVIKVISASVNYWDYKVVQQFISILFIK